MTRTRWVVGSFVLLLVLGLVLAACGGAQEPAANLDGKVLVQERCTVCHPLSNVTGAAKSRDGWQSTVERMIGHGAQLTDAEKTAVIDHLAAAYPQ